MNQGRLRKGPRGSACIIQRSVMLLARGTHHKYNEEQCLLHVVLSSTNWPHVLHPIFSSNKGRKYCGHKAAATARSSFTFSQTIIYIWTINDLWSPQCCCIWLVLEISWTTFIVWVELGIEILYSFLDVAALHILTRSVTPIDSLDFGGCFLGLWVVYF